MPTLDQVVSLTITRDSVGVSVPGFGIPLILSANAAFADRVRSYTSLAGVEADFATTTPEYLQAALLFSGSNKPEKIKIGRLANKPTQRYRITVQTVTNSQIYKVKVNGTEASFTADGTATNDEIVAGLVSAINTALGGSRASADTTDGTGSHKLLLTAASAGEFLGLDVRAVNDNLDLLTVIQNHADPGLAADLAAITNADADYYFILHPYNSVACISAISTFAEANKRLFVAGSSDTNNITLADGSDSVSVAKVAKVAALSYTSIWYHHDSGAFVDSRLVGACAPLDPGSETWAFKSLSGVAATVLTATHQTNLEAKNANYYQAVAGASITFPGKVAKGDFIDLVRFLDWFRATTQAAIFSRMAALSKIPFTDPGIAIVEAELRGVIGQGVDVGGIATDPAPVVTVPRASAVSSANRTARILPDVKFTWTYAGAIHKVTISGVVSL